MVNELTAEQSARMNGAYIAGQYLANRHSKRDAAPYPQATVVMELGAVIADWILTGEIPAKETAA